MTIGFVCTTYGQRSMTVYSNGVVGISTDQKRRISSELKFFTDRTFGNGFGLLEYDAFINLRKHKYHQVSFGLGLNLQSINRNIINALEAPLNLRIYPFESNEKAQFLSRLSLIIEISPEFYPNYEYFEDCWNVRKLIGIRFDLSD